MNKSLGETLTALRKEAGLTQPRVSALLREEGVDILTAGISKWEKGLTLPNAVQFLALCRIYGVTDVMGTFTDAPAQLGMLNADGRRLVYDYIRVLVASKLYEETVPEPAERVLPLYSMAASAGFGQFLDGEDFEPRTVNASVPESADFGVRIAGDSMEPFILDGATVWVRRCETLTPGQIGVFFYAGQAYCKRLERRGERAYLVSLNPEYTPIRIDAAGGLRVFGEVVAVS